jgi:hypothetical protein
MEIEVTWENSLENEESRIEGKKKRESQRNVGNERKMISPTAGHWRQPPNADRLSILTESSQRRQTISSFEVHGGCLGEALFR